MNKENIFGLDQNYKYWKKGLSKKLIQNSIRKINTIFFFKSGQMWDQLNPQKLVIGLFALIEDISTDKQKKIILIRAMNAGQNVD